MHVPVPEEDNTMGADTKLIVLGERPGSGDPVLRAPKRGDESADALVPSKRSGLE